MVKISSNKLEEHRPFCIDQLGQGFVAAQPLERLGYALPVAEGAVEVKIPILVADQQGLSLRSARQAGKASPRSRSAGRWFFARKPGRSRSG